MGLVGEVGTTKLSRLSDCKLTVRAAIALVLANIRYWPSVAPIVREQVKQWEQHAKDIPDETLRTLALEKIHSEHFNAEVAATLATLAPRAYRRTAIEAIVAYEVMYDYLDGLTELPTADPIRDGRQLFKAFTDAISPDAGTDSDYYRYHSSDDDGYLATLAHTVRVALGKLPGALAVTAAAIASATRCAEAQTRVHAAEQGAATLEEWASEQAEGTCLQWRAFIAGAAASVLAVHALIAAAADRRTTPEQATAIDNTYLSISAVSTMLDSLIDYKLDSTSGTPWYLKLYERPSQLGDELATVARGAKVKASALRHPGHHAMTIIGVVAYYTSAPAADDRFSRPLITRIQRELRPVITAALAVMHAWRIAKTLKAPSRVGNEARPSLPAISSVQPNPTAMHNTQP